MTKPQTDIAANMPQNIADAQVFATNMAEQLRMAGLVQRDFLPSQLPNSDRFHWAAVFLPAEWVSGDFYDVVRIDEQHIGFYIADVVGHGVPAALLTIFLKQALVMRKTTANSYRIFSPAEVMKNLNSRLAAQRLSGHQFITCCYCLLNITTLQLTYARAGHPYPVLIRPDRPLQQLQAQGSLLGIFKNAGFDQQTIQLKEGDKLLLYSDGAEPFIGAFDDLNGFSFDEQFVRLRELAIEQLIERFNRIVEGQENKRVGLDDITAVGLEIL